MIRYGMIAIVVAIVTAGCAPGLEALAPRIAQVRGAVVHVVKLSASGQARQGSGCLISPDGILFTAKHVTDGEFGAVYAITLDDGRSYPVKYVLEDRDNDVAFLKLDRGACSDDANLPYARLADHNILRAGDFAFIMGSPLGRDNFNSVSLGIISAARRNLDATWSGGYGYGWSALFQSDATAAPGNSGGPVFDMHGRVIGVLVAGMADTINYSVSVAVFRSKLETARRWFDLLQLRPLVQEELCLDDGMAERATDPDLDR